MTKKLYYDDPYLARCDARVLSCTRAKEGWHAVLDQTVFFARGGGQPCEEGTIGEARVLDVWEENEGVIHLLDREVPMGPAPCALDLDMRLDHMRQHLGEHIFSAILARDYGAQIGILRIEGESAHIEINKALLPEQLARAEAETKKVIAQNLPVKTYTLTPDEAAQRLPRHKAAARDVVRIVELPGLDVNPCGGTHCRSTGEVGDFVLCGSKAVRGMFRIYFKCGARATAELEDRTRLLLKLQTAFGVEETRNFSEKALACLERKTHLEELTARQREELLEKDVRLTVAEAEEAGGYLFLAKDMTGDVKHSKEVCTRVTQEHNAILLFALPQEEQVSVIMARSKGKIGPDMGALFKELTNLCGGKGGGSVILAQGVIPSEGLEAFRQMAERVRQDLESADTGSHEQQV